MNGWNKDEKTLVVIGVLVIAVVLVGMVIQNTVIPIARQAAYEAEQAAREAKARDDVTIIAPKGSDLDIAGRWVDAVSYEWTGKPSFEYEFKSDGTYTFRFTHQNAATTGRWGRLKGDNQLVTRRDDDTFQYSRGNPLRLDKSGKLFCDGFSLVRMN